MCLIVLCAFLLMLINNSYCKREIYPVSDKEYASIPVLFKLDDYDSCMELGDEGLFCSFTYKLEPLDTEREKFVWNIIKKITSEPRNYRHDSLRHGICLPMTCPKNTTEEIEEHSIRQRIEDCYNKRYKHLGLNGNITKIRCESRNSEYPIDILDIIVGTLFISYIIFVIFASIYEGVARYQKKDVYEKITDTLAGKVITAFSVPKNWYRLVSSNSSPDAVKLRSIQGIRFYNMICVILCHTTMITFAGPIANTKYPENATNKPLNMYLANGNYAVQSFFLISGWLLSLHFFQMFEGKNIQWKHLVLAFVNRYIRLTPTLLVMIAFESTWMVHMGRGPLWDQIVAQEFRNCRKNWWTNLLYINNYVDKYNMCLHQTWYIASDTQLFILSLLLLTIAWKYQNQIKQIFGLAILVGLICQGVTAFINNYDIVIRQYPEDLYDLHALKLKAWHDLYSSGYSNITGYVIGLTFGYLFYKFRNKTLVVKKVHVILWWILTFGMCNFVVLIAARMYQPGYEYTAFESAMYWAFGKNLFALGVAIGIFGFTQKIGWFAKWFCEWRSVQIFGRLTYSTYIIHTALIRIRSGYTRSPIYINDYLMLTTALGDIVLSYLGGTVLCLIVEMPISALQKLMMPHLEAKRLKGSSEKSLKTLDCEENDSEKQGGCTKV